MAARHHPRRLRPARPPAPAGPGRGVRAAAADLLTATAAAWEGTAGGPLTRAAELFDRAAHEYTPIAPATAGSGGYPLRTIARLLAATSSTGRHREQPELKAMLRLVRAMAGLAAAVADLRDAQRRLHQAEAARKAATHLTTYRPPIAATVGAAADDAMALPHVVLPVLAPVRPTGHGR